MYAADKPLPIYLYKHEFWGFFDMVTTATTNPATLAGTQLTILSSI